MLIWCEVDMVRRRGVPLDGTLRYRDGLAQRAYGEQPRVAVYARLPWGGEVAARWSPEGRRETGSGEALHSKPDRPSPARIIRGWFREYKMELMNNIPVALQATNWCGNTSPRVAVSTRQPWAVLHMPFGQRSLLSIPFPGHDKIVSHTVTPTHTPPASS